MIDFGILPPEVNSTRMYSGVGVESLMAAAASWDALAADLSQTTQEIRSVITGVQSAWRGPSAAAMSGSISTYLTWLESTAENATTTASQARAAASAFETAYVLIIPPTIIAYNRLLLQTLIATNLFGQNTAAIAANETEYAEYWAQDAAAMYAYTTNSTAATSGLKQFTPAHTTASALTTTTPTSAATSTTSAQSILTTLWDDWVNPDTFLGQVNAYTNSFVSSGAAFSTIPQILALMTMLWTIGAATNIMGSNAKAMIEPPIINVPSTPSFFDKKSVTVGPEAARVGPLRVPPSWYRVVPPPGPSPAVALSSGISSAAERPWMPMPIGAVSGGTPNKEKRPEPEYGVKPRVMVPHPWGG